MRTEDLRDGWNWGCKELARCVDMVKAVVGVDREARYIVAGSGASSAMATIAVGYQSSSYSELLPKRHKSPETERIFKTKVKISFLWQFPSFALPCSNSFGEVFFILLICIRISHYKGHANASYLQRLFISVDSFCHWYGLVE